MSIGRTRPGSTGLTPIGPVVHCTSAMPSVLPLAAASKAIMPLAPLRFSTTTRWLSRFWTASENSRATVSPMPPGWKPTTIFTGPLSGLNSGSAARAAAGRAAANSAAITHCLKSFPFPFAGKATPAGGRALASYSKVLRSAYALHRAGAGARLSRAAHGV